jgi:hypothetical protein
MLGHYTTAPYAIINNIIRYRLTITRQIISEFQAIVKPFLFLFPFPHFQEGSFYYFDT